MTAAHAGGSLGPAVWACIAEGCLEDTWPGEDWVIIDSPVGAFEVLMCDRHYFLFEKGEFNPTGNSWARAVELVNEYPVVHG